MTQHEQRVVITGVAISCALGTDTEKVWRSILDGDSGIRLTQRLDVSTLSCHYSGELGPVALPAHRPRGRLDRASRLALNAARDALESAALDPSEVDSYRIGLALGTSVGGLDEGEQFHWELLRDGPDAVRRHHLLVYPLYTSADAVSVAFGLKGPKAVVSNACAAGANSIGYAADTISSGRADVMLAGGVDVLDILSFAGFDSLKALDARPCAPYSRSTGLNLGEGAAMLVLESETSANRRAATPLGYLRGYALTSDAHHATAPDPAGSGARRAMANALGRAGLTPGDVDYVNGHGTGTPANDGAETKAVDSLFGPSGPPMSSTKSQVGHMLGAAGAIEAAICVLALRDKRLPPTINVADPAALRRDVVPNAARAADVRVIVSNSFAFGGNNCSVVLGADPGPTPSKRVRRVVITGAGVVSPLGTGRSEFVDAVRAGDVAIKPSAAVDTSLARTGLVAEIPDTGYRRYVDPGYARRLDQLGVLVLSATRMALQDSSFAVTNANSERVGMIFGTYTGPLETVARLTETIGTQGPHKVSPKLFPNSVMNAAAGHACLALRIRGPLSTLASGCASGMIGLGYAADQIRADQADVMLAVSADELTPMLHFGYDRLGLLASDSVRPYDQDSSGCALGAGSAVLVLEELDHALARGATILAEVTGHAVTSDAYRVAGNEPSGEAWSESFRRALADAERQPGDVGVFYGDARGTAVLDLAEARAVSEVWRPGEIAVANLSGQVGHLHSTTSLLSAVCAVESIRTGWAPRLAAAHDRLPEIAGYTGALRSAGHSAVVTAANWGGTYATAVLSPWSP
nr:beta-ketoacyl-[acyl-carrier-protein] synthase family protein [Kibdelosporangium sp. MJ126-NF4]CEL17820.1 3-oxoacyl-[acyl-carrier-protein] synthase / Chain length factor [Kibdelosporangium sp. MJ126-NF4]CTQ90956.1 3-oxoacyl-[acyl-carrier-protein] synthase / Chain length factor(EC:2.3.1.41) [Kibdelosporangium sp. MJ126-NF4]